MRDLKDMVIEGFHENTSSGMDSAKQQVLDRVQELFNTSKYNPDIKQVIVNDDLTVDVNTRGGDVTIEGIEEDSIGVKFNKITGALFIRDCKNLKTLEGCPSKVSGGFIVERCDSLKTLEGGPTKVDKPGSKFQSINPLYFVSDCKNLDSLVGGPNTVATMWGKLHLKNLPSLKSLSGLSARTLDGVNIIDCANLVEIGDKSIPKNMRGTLTIKNCPKLKTLDVKKTLSIRCLTLGGMDQFTLEDVLGTNYKVSRISTQDCKQIEDMDKVDTYDLKNK